MTLGNHQPLRVAAVVATVLFSTFAATGQSVPQASGQSQSPVATATNQTSAVSPPGNHWGLGVAVDYSYVAGGDASFQGNKAASEAQSVNVGVMGEIPVNDRWFVPLRIGSRNLFLGTVAGTPIPGQISTLGLDTGLGCRWNDQWMFSASLGPRLYRFNDVGGDEVGVGGLVMATYQWKPDLTVGVGLNFEPDRQVPVLPGAGLQWDIRPNLTLDLMWPRTALIYRVDKPLELFVGASGNFAVFRAGPNEGNNIGQPAFNNALGTYRDFHLGAGAEYRLGRGLSASVEGGYSVGREIDYTDLNQSVTFKASPYVQTGLRWRF